MLTHGVSRVQGLVLRIESRPCYAHTWREPGAGPRPSDRVPPPLLPLLRLDQRRIVLAAVCCSVLFLIGAALVGGCSAAMLRIRGSAPFLMAAGGCAAAVSIAATTALSRSEEHT